MKTILLIGNVEMVLKFNKNAIIIIQKYAFKNILYKMLTS